MKLPTNLYAISALDGSKLIGREYPSLFFGRENLQGSFADDQFLTLNLASGQDKKLVNSLTAQISHACGYLKTKHFAN